MGDNKEIIVQNCQTSREIRKFEFNWTIENFPILIMENYVESPKLPSADSDISFILRIYRRSDLLILDVDPFVRNKIVPKNWYYEVNVQFASHPDSNYRKGSNFNCIIKFDEVPLNHYAHIYLPGNQLTIHCSIQVMTNKVFNNLSFNAPKCDLIKNLGVLFDSKEFCDVVIKTADGHELRAHKLILCARSPVFAAMFKLPTKESQENIIAIDDFNNDVIAEMLRFIYTGDAPKLSEMSENLLAAADKYAIERLKQMCVGYLCERLSVENASNILRLADLYNAPELKMRCEQFITVHYHAVGNTLQPENLIKMILEKN